MYYIYLLYSDAADKYYCGYSDDAFRRLNEHNNSPHNTFSSKYRPWTIVALFECGTSRSNAMRIEKFIKKQKSRRIFEQLRYSSEFYGPLAQLVRVPHLRD
ncbi:MAG: GIY-YIG nuclease family protein [Bacteroidota bacterium]